LRRPERLNGLGPTLARELADELATLRALPEAKLPRLLALTAAPVTSGERQVRTWIAGGDLKELAAETGRERGLAYASTMAAFLDGLDGLPIPVAVAVDGDAIGGGAELAIAGDYRVMTRGSRLVFKQMEIGLATGYASTRRLVALVGLARAQDILLGARTLTAEQARDLGLVHDVVNDWAELRARLDERAERLATLAPAAVAAQKKMLHLAGAEAAAAASRAELEVFASLWGNPAHAAALARFLEPSPSKAKS
jgi:enoyl-CoA hydratase/carnithine racemase